jgi:hypothetical protein
MYVKKFKWIFFFLFTSVCRKNRDSNDYDDDDYALGRKVNILDFSKNGLFSFGNYESIIG